MPQLKSGDESPHFALLDQNETQVALNDYTGRKLFVFFYPKANTSG